MTNGGSVSEVRKPKRWWEVSQKMDERERLIKAGLPDPGPPVGSLEWYEAVEAEAQREFEAKRRKEKGQRASEMKRVAYRASANGAELDHRGRYASARSPLYCVRGKSRP